ncbi:MAG: hypothetical protein B7Y37_11690 [Sphingobacteriia bacterium 28-36-52]|nr:MAG: hypothetical protein B7Y37_11690 [Sphingobacteriia bacterium 28-36-52]
MKKVTSILLVLSIVIGLVSCKKKAEVEPPEETLRVSSNPIFGSDVIGALSSTYSFKLLITSKPPKNGVKVDISVKNDLDNSVVFSQSTQTSSSSITSVDLQLASLIAGNLYTSTVDITSLTTPTNKAQLIFKIARK